MLGGPLLLMAAAGGGGVAYRYWRMFITEVDQAPASSIAALAELEFRDSVGGSQAATGGTAAASDARFGAASQAFDGDLGTFWATGVSPASYWLSYDFGTPIAIVEAAMRTRSGVTSQTPTAFVFQGSDDNVTWVDVSSHTISPTPAAQTWVTFTF